MRLTVKDAARLLSVSEKTVYRWIRAGALPAHRLGDQYRFNRAELLEWATGRRLNVAPEIFHEPESELASLPTVSEALAAGGIHYRVGGATKAEALRAMVEVLPLPVEVDREFLLKVVTAREALGSTAVGDGIALPHVRSPAVLHVPQPLVALCFLEKPVDFGAIDGRPVAILIAVLAPTTRAHLHLLSRLAYLLAKESLRRVLAEGAGREEIARTLRELEAELPERPAEPARCAGEPARSAGEAAP
jgi:PTS system nitrogen regulatory IIA component